MKKIIYLLLVVVAFVGLSACSKERTYAHDGDYTVFEYVSNQGRPEITFVTVTIKNDKIEKFDIDCLEGTKTETDGVQTSAAWKEKSKKELGDSYGMKDYSGIEKEWYEQIAAIEAHLLANGTDSITTNESGLITNVSGATISDASYSKLAAQAVENAKVGKVQAFECLGSGEITWASATVDGNGKLSDVVIDAVQFNLKTDPAKWNFNSSKRTLGDNYGMKDYSGIAKEWYEQADFLASEFEKNADLTVTDGKFVMSGASISDNGITTVLNALKSSVK